MAHGVSSSYNPHANQRAEQGVKSAKRLLRGNIGADGNLQTEAFLRGLMLHRNTPDKDTGLSQSQVKFGRATRNFFPINEGNLVLHPEWRISMEQREKALARRHARREQELSEHTKALKPLQKGQVVMIQNQAGNSPRRWDKSGVVLEVKEFDQYRIKVDGTGRITVRNRRYLKPIVPYERMIQSGRMDEVEGQDSRMDASSQDAVGGSRVEAGSTEIGEEGPILRRSSRERRHTSRLGMAVMSCSKSSQWGRT